DWTYSLFRAPWNAWALFSMHAVLVSYLIVASFCDLDTREIPLTITVPGTVIGLIFATAFPWPWPNSPPPITPDSSPMRLILITPEANLVPKQGLYPWPFWLPLPAPFAPGGNWQTGLVTGLAGVLVGTALLRSIRAIFSYGLGVEALGLGD